MSNFKKTDCLFIRYLAPTLCGIKPANLFTLSLSDYASINLTKWIFTLKKNQLSLVSIKSSINRIMIFSYDFVWIRKILSDAFIQAYLIGKGYSNPSDTSQTLKELFLRLENQKGFPHEVGLFLGYPIEDVIGFEENEGRNCKCCSYWKSYSDPSIAKSCCAQYKWCSEMCKQWFVEGLSVPQIIKKYKEAVDQAA